MSGVKISFAALLPRKMTRIGQTVMSDNPEASSIFSRVSGTDAFEQFIMRSAAVKLIIEPTDGKILDVNEAAAQFYGWSREQIRGKYLWDINTSMSRERLLEHLARTVREEAIYFQTQHSLANGQVKDLIVFHTLVQVNGRNVIVSIVQDLSQQKGMERELLQAQNTAAEKAERFSRFFEQNSAVEMVVDPAALKVVDANNAAVQYYGWPRDILKKMSLLDISVLPGETIEKYFKTLLEKGTGHIQTQHKMAEGEIRDVEIYITVINDDGCKLFFSIIHDITDRVRMEKSLHYSQITLAESEERFRQIFECNSAAELFVSADDRKIMDANEAACRFYGWDRTELLRMNLAEISTIGEERLKELFRDVLAGKHLKMECRHRLKSGQVRDVETYLSHVVIQRKDYVFIIVHDISERKKAEASLNLAQRAMDATASGIIICDAQLPDNPIIYMNTGFTKLTGYGAEECLGRNPRFLQNSDLDQPGLAVMREAIKAGMATIVEIRNYQKNGAMYWNEVHISPVRDAQGQLTHFLGIQEDITERKKNEARIDYLAYFDPLTDLPNRQLFLDRLCNVLALAHRSGQYGSIAVIDLDNFKIINDAEGLETGDELLKEMARRLQTCLRQEDTLARFGGDEFVVLLPGLENNMQMAAHEVRNVMERIRLAVAEPIVIKGLPHQITTSIGITLFPKGAESAADLLQQADTAMYKAKTAGRNAIAYFEPTMQIAVQERFRMESDLRAAVEHGDFEMFLQPQVDTGGLLVGAEALIRWRNRNGGLISPDAFIPLAEETGLIVPMGEWMMAQACAAIARLSRAGREIRIAVNVSPRQFRVRNFKERIARILTETGIKPSLLTLEVTEAVIFDSFVNALEAMREIRELGVTFSIDDFGTGYSSLSYLKKMPVSELKIDRSFIQDAPGNPNDAALVEAIIAVALHHNLHVVAEGVETQEHVDFLNARGCPLFQGYFFGRPIPAEEFLTKFLPSSTIEGVCQ